MAGRSGRNGRIVIRTDAARTRMLGAIRENLAASASHDPHEQRMAVPAAGPRSHELDNAKQRFMKQLAAVGAHCTVVRSEAEAAAALVAILTSIGARCVAGSDSALVQRLLRAAGGSFVLKSIEHLSRDELFASDAGVTTAQWGIAETGTLVLESACERSRLLSLVPPVHVALLSAGRICDSLADALARVHQSAREGQSRLESHAITFITGPSRTSDIELTLVVGVHGPQTVHVLLLEDG